MKLTYLPDDLVIISDDPDRPVIASLSGLALPALHVNAMGRLLAATPALLGHLQALTDVEPDDFGDRTVSAEFMEPVWEQIANLP